MEGNLTMYEKGFQQKLRGHILFSIFLLALDIIFGIKAIQMLIGLEKFVGLNFFIYVLGIFLSSVILFFFYKKMVTKEPAVILSDKGIQINGYAAKIGLIPWVEIKGCVEYSMKGQQLLGLLLYNEDQFLNTIPTVKKNILIAHKTSGHPIINIPINNLKDKKGFLTALAHMNVTFYSTSNMEESRAN